jgi:hypothetical protein
MLSLNLLDTDIEERKKCVERGEEDRTNLDFLLNFRDTLKNTTKSDWEIYNDLIEHLPNDNNNPLKTIITGLLVVEKLIRRFISLRYQQPPISDNQSISVSLCIDIAENMCLAREVPKWLWNQVRELNEIRNKLVAQSFLDKKTENQIANFVSEISKVQKLHDKTITGAISFLYGMIKGLCDLSESKEFEASHIEIVEYRSNKFYEVINCKTKKDITSLCKKTQVSSEEFTDFIIACKSGMTHLNHVMHYYDYVPEHLEVRDEDWKILDVQKEAEQSTKREKTFRRLFKSHGQRKYKVGHMFISKELSHPLSEWHFVFFEINELKDKNNHWMIGSHFHIVNYLWTNMYCQDIWNDFIQNKVFPSTKLHVSYSDKNRK